MTKFDKALDYAIEHIITWKHKDAISSIFLYGSCARNEQNAESDIDLFIELNEEVPMDAIRQLRTEANPADWKLPEVEIKFGQQGCFEQENLFYRNIKRDGVLLWKRK